MKTLTKLTLATVTGLAAVALLAQDAQRPQRPGGPGGPGGEGRPRMMLPLVATLDADGNGEISAEEITNAAAALKKLDKNGDGKLTRDEYMGMRGGPGGPGGPGGEGRPRRPQAE